MTKKKPTVKKPAVKKPAVKKAKAPAETSKTKADDSESVYEAFRGATISTDRLQPEKSTCIYLDLETDDGTETHLINMRLVPQDIIDSWIGDLD